ncbi:MAG: hypothetical protein E7418_04570 [Ruminococcaceae bacterium]|nr:hypothetical protein [Oscillospiraceae bacterium]
MTELLEDMILRLRADTFYIGAESEFEKMVVSVLEALKETHPHISCTVVIPKAPKKELNEQNTVYLKLPKGLDEKHRLSVRNNWLLAPADFLICCAPTGDEAFEKALKEAEKNGQQWMNVSGYICDQRGDA